MASESYYYLFNVITTIGLLLHIVNMLYFRTNSKTIFGQKFKRGAADYQFVEEFSQNPRLLVAILVAALSIVNTVYSVYQVMQRGTSESQFLLYFVPIFTVVMFVIAISMGLRKIEQK